MSKPHKSYRVYRTFLYLYPKSHRDAYGQQMVQTLDDILSDQRSRSERFTVWLRVMYELPINAIEENFNSMGEISVNKLTKISNRKLVYGVVAVLVLGSYVALGVLWQHQRGRINSLDSSLEVVSENQFAMSGGTYRDVTIAPSEHAVYFPHAKIKLPEDSVLNMNMVYTYRPTEKIAPDSDKMQLANLSISTRDLSKNNYSNSQFSCAEVAYADFGSPSWPVNPKYKSNGKVTLADGRIMNIYYAPKIPGCENTWKLNGVDAKAIADSLMQAASY